jgi:hypothetical protein
MSRYRTYFPTDEQALTDGDSAFLKFTSRRQNTLLEPGTLEVSENMRLDRTTAKVRAGLKSISTDIDLDNDPIVLDFTLGTDVAITSITRSVNTATVTTTGAHGYTTGDQVNIRGAAQADYNGDYTITVTAATTFTYTVANTPVTPATGTMYVNKGPVLFTTYADVVQCSTVFATNDNDNTEYIIAASTDSAWAIRGGVSSQQIAYPANEQVEATDDASMHYWNGSVFLFRGHQTAAAAAVTSITSAAGTATVTATAAHNRTTNDWVFIEGASPLNYNGIFQITVTGATTFTYAVAGGPASPASGTITYRPCKVPLVWDGNFANDFVAVSSGADIATYIKMPPCGWGVDFKNRLIVPYDRDEILLSDLYDANRYDTTRQQLRIRGGTNDWLIGVHPYQNSQFLVLYRRSLHLVDLSDVDLSVIGVTEITRDIGCVSRRSVVTCGERILWLSDRGVQFVHIGDLLSLRQSSKPLSDDIDDVIQRINMDAADTIVATYWDNRYFLAVPLDDATTASSILVYNFLNEGWESIDSYPESFNVENFHQIDYGGSKRLHVTTTYGFAYVMEENTGDEWGVNGTQVAIPGALDTRFYTGGDLAPKGLRRFSLEANLTTGDAFTATAVTKNPDDASTAETFTATATTDKLFRLPFIGLIGSGAQLSLRTTAGRPEFRSIIAEFKGKTFRGNQHQS